MKSVVIAQEIIEPNVGIKFMTKAMNPQTTGKSTFNIHVDKPTKSPVANETLNLIEINLTTSDMMFDDIFKTLFFVEPSNAEFILMFVKRISANKNTNINMVINNPLLNEIIPVDKYKAPF